jgi:hypothetical protein
MQIIHHRRNTIELLQQTAPEHGVEVDIRSRGPDLIIHHDAFVDGVSFDEWLSHYRHQTLILNVKEEGLEQRLQELMARAGINDYFFLDQSFPFLIRTSSAGERRSAVRVSEYEGLTSALALAGRIDWAWIDCFTRFPLTKADAHLLSEHGYKLCLVSPELQGRVAEEGIGAMRELLAREAIEPAAVCTKRPDLWL